MKSGFTLGPIRMTRSINVKASHDAEAGVWYVEESDLLGDSFEGGE